MSKTQFRPKVEIEPYNSKLTNYSAAHELNSAIGTMLRIIHKPYLVKRQKEAILNSNIIEHLLKSTHT